MLWAFLISFNLSVSWSEYRVYQFRIKDSETEAERLVNSTLDPWQYPVYHPLGPNEKLQWVDHWMCWRRRQPHTPLCQRPGWDIEPKSESEQETTEEDAA